MDVLVDLGFLGAEKEQVDVIVTYKKPRQSGITSLQMTISKAVGSVRVRIEHVFSGEKRLKIV
ncbi:MAG: hypothetical protein JJU23_13525 [Cyclobacteriaceae bacterium]|nr:hypothetical protein [Cyclobacteriaceae bacterium]